MMRRPRSSLVVALLGACLILGACNQGGSTTSSRTEPAASTAEAAQDQTNSVPGVSIHRRTDSPAPPSPSASPTASARPAPATVPAGYATVTAPTAGITFAAPADWQVISASEIQTDESKLEEVANAAGVSADALKAAMSTADIYILDQSGTQDFSNNINVLSRTYSSATVTENAMTTGVKSIGATPGRFSTESTANGDAHVLTYTWDLGGQTLEGAAMYVPNTDGKYASVTVTTLDAALTERIADTIIATAA
ncbi:MAG: hypothetical protein ACFNME_09790 [Actinomyces dentalis]